jgi:hypothetical protein
VLSQSLDSKLSNNVNILFFRITRYSVDAQNTHAHSTLWTHRRKPYPYEHLRKTEPANLKIHEVTTGLWTHVRKLYPYEHLQKTEPTDLKIHEVTTNVLLSKGRRLPPRTCTHTHPYEDTYANPTVMKTSDRRLAIDRDVAYHWKHSTVKSCNKFRKMRAPVSSRRLEPGWAGSTTNNPISWATLSSQQCQYTWS